MKQIFKTVISKGDYNLTSLLEKIDAYHIEGKLTNEDKAELYALAQADKPVNQYNYAAEIEMLWAAVKELQNRAPIVDEEPEEEEAEAKPFTQPTGAHDAYQIGDLVTFNGETFRCVMANNVYSPAVYPMGWEKV